MNNTSSLGYRYQIKEPSGTDDSNKANNGASHSATTEVLHDRKGSALLHRRKIQAITNTPDIAGETTDGVFLSEKFKKSITKLKHYSSKAKKEIGLIVRFNNNDIFADVFWSEQYNYIHQPTVSLGYKREKATKVVLKKSGYEKSTAQPDLGGHCEEIFIRSWDRIIKYNDCNPKVVDVVISHSPCMNHSALFLDNSGHLWPAGCSPKLYKLISEQKQVNQWNIIYVQKNSDHCADAAIAKLNRHPRVRIFNCKISTEVSLSRVI
ncbi:MULTISPECIES: hypothetical protein [Gammaproteobacteria]|uniref:hypothetical protein n=1 Tax=Gammaproteobacteria TaxID=1236 RepID=UPI001ADC8D89|nr:MULTISPECIES: hypothetical protein [Gammaproteobacteria]MBO9484592.1 hypothetical protein [Salinisphaera sp. G21_0]MBO9497195.1 hypothetical protein [Thalassotalea sp. G20_0]